MAISPDTIGSVGTAKALKATHPTLAHAIDWAQHVIEHTEDEEQRARFTGALELLKQWQHG